MITKEDLAQAILELKSSYLRLEASQEKSDRRLDKVAKLVGNISNNQGDIAEEFFYNSLKAKPTLAGINYDFIDKNITRSKNKIEDEYDILLVNGKDIAIIETKYKAHANDIEKLVNKAKEQLETYEKDDLVKEYLEQGVKLKKIIMVFHGWELVKIEEYKKG